MANGEIEKAVSDIINESIPQELRDAIHGVQTVLPKKTKAPSPKTTDSLEQRVARLEAQQEILDTYGEGVISKLDKIAEMLAAISNTLLFFATEKMADEDATEQIRFIGDGVDIDD